MRRGRDHIDLSDILMRVYSPNFKIQSTPAPSSESTPVETPDLSSMSPLPLPSLRSPQTVLSPNGDFLKFDNFSLEAEGAVRKTRQRSRRKNKELFYESSEEDIVLEILNGLGDGSLEIILDIGSDEQSMTQSSGEDNSQVIEEEEEEQIEGTVSECNETERSAPVVQGYRFYNQKEILQAIQESFSSEAESESEQLTALYCSVKSFLIDFEIPRFEETWNHLGGSFQEVVSSIKAGIGASFRKHIGALTFAERRIKLVRYLNKKKRRVWDKKVNYICRKNVADNRLRVKGKFVTQEQACKRLGVNADSLDLIRSKSAPAERSDL